MLVTLIASLACGCNTKEQLDIDSSLFANSHNGQGGLDLDIGLGSGPLTLLPQGMAFVISQLRLKGLIPTPPQNSQTLATNRPRALMVHLMGFISIRRAINRLPNGRSR